MNNLHKFYHQAIKNRIFIDNHKVVLQFFYEDHSKIFHTFILLNKIKIINRFYFIFRSLFDLYTKQTNKRLEIVFAFGVNSSKIGQGLVYR